MIEKFFESFNLEEKIEPFNIGKKEVITDIEGKLDYSPIYKSLENKGFPLEGNGGSWEGERGNSKWTPDNDYIPQKANPESKTWEEIKKDTKIDGISFKEGEPDFKEISKGSVEIESFSADRSDNFDRADIELAKEYNCSPEDVKTWRKENKYTWHECKDMKTMEKVPSIVHNNISHRGGISEVKKELNSNE